MAVVFKCKEFDIENVVFTQPKQTKHGSTAIYASYRNVDKGGRMHKLRIQLPKMPVPGGVAIFEKKETNGQTTKRYSIYLSFSDVDTNERRRVALEKLRKFDQRIIEELMKNCKSWLKQPNVTRELADILYKHCVRISKDKETGEPDGKYADSIKVNIPVDKDGRVNVPTFDENMNPVDLLTYLTKGCSVIPILQCNGLWVIASQLHLSWKLENIQIFPSDQLRGFAIKPESDDEETEEAKEMKEEMKEEEVVAEEASDDE